MRDAAPMGVHHRITDALPSSPERITSHHPASDPIPDALDLAVRLLARQAKQESPLVTAQEEQESTTDTTAPVTCFSCWGVDFWQGSGAVVCRRCHPPAPGAEVLATCPTKPDSRPATAPESASPDGDPSRTSGASEAPRERKADE